MELVLLALLLATASTPMHAADGDVAPAVGQPGFYGRVDVRDFPPPQLLYHEPRLIRRGAAGRAPIYMHVPQDHARNWRRHCAAYGACDERVYFVRDDWYREQFVPHYREQNRFHRDEQNDGVRGEYFRNDRGSPENDATLGDRK